MRLSAPFPRAGSQAGTEHDRHTSGQAGRSKQRRLEQWRTSGYGGDAGHGRLTRQRCRR